MSRIPPRPSSWRPLGNRFTRWLGRTGLALMGWRFEGALPAESRLIIILAPHTSNWDFFIGVFALLGLDARVNWMGKHTIFRWPINGLLRSLGGLPVVRHAARDVVDQMVDTFAREPQMLLALAPEGTRRHVGRFKTGFLRIAREAEVPILPVGLDYESRCLVLGKPFIPPGNIADAERACYDYFRRYKPRHPQQY